MEATTFWIAGIAVSAVCVASQLIMYLLMPKTRATQLIILTQMMLARLLNTVSEYVLLNENYTAMEVTFAVYLQSDAVLVIWMFVFTKYLHDNLAIGQSKHCCSFTLLSTLIWILTIPVGLMCPLSLYLNMFEAFYKAYSVVKFVILTINVLLFSRIIYLVFKRNASNGKLRDGLKFGLVCFVALCVTTVHVLVNDLVTFFIGSNPSIESTFCVLNSYHVVLITVAAIFLFKSALFESVHKDFHDDASQSSIETNTGPIYTLVEGKNPGQLCSYQIKV